MACALCVCYVCCVSGFVQIHSRFICSAWWLGAAIVVFLSSYIALQITKSEKKKTPENLWTEKILKSHSASTRSCGWKREEINAKCTQFIFETRSSLAVDYYHPPVDCVIFAHAIIQNRNWYWNRNFFLWLFAKVAVAELRNLSRMSECGMVQRAVCEF